MASAVYRNADQLTVHVAQPRLTQTLPVDDSALQASVAAGAFRRRQRRLHTRLGRLRLHSSKRRLLRLLVRRRRRQWSSERRRLHSPALTPRLSLSRYPPSPLYLRHWRGPTRFLQLWNRGLQRCPDSTARMSHPGTDRFRGAAAIAIACCRSRRLFAERVADSFAPNLEQSACEEPVVRVVGAAVLFSSPGGGSLNQDLRFATCAAGWLAGLSVALAAFERSWWGVRPIVCSPSRRPNARRCTGRFFEFVGGHAERASNTSRLG